MHSTPHPGPADAEAAKTILVVEDEVLVRLVISDYLRDCGDHVVEAASAAAAKAVLQSNTKVDLVFSDVQMPGEADERAVEWQSSLRVPRGKFRSSKLGQGRNDHGGLRALAGRGNRT
jgi:hypothetical protein